VSLFTRREDVVGLSSGVGVRSWSVILTPLLRSDCGGVGVSPSSSIGCFVDNTSPSCAAVGPCEVVSALHRGNPSPNIKSLTRTATTLPPQHPVTFPPLSFTCGSSRVTHHARQLIRHHRLIRAPRRQMHICYLRHSHVEPRPPHHGLPLRI